MYGNLYGNLSGTRSAHACCARAAHVSCVDLPRIAARVLSSLCVLAPWTPAFGQSFPVPDGCTPKFTVQYQGCLMMNLWTCTADAPDEKWTMLFNEGGPIRLRKVNGDFQWLETYHMDGSSEEIVKPSADPSNMSELLSTNRDTYDFEILEDGEVNRYLGFDALTGEEPVIDGERLLRTEYAYEQFTADGTPLGGAKGNQFVHPEFRIFLFGQSTDLNGENGWSTLPRQFYRPGDPGFFPNTPIFDCGVVTSHLQKETPHDHL